MKLKSLGFRKLKLKRKPSTQESPLLQEHNLPNTEQQQPGWLKGWHDFENHITEGWINARKSSGIS
jgi:hypothetical protein